MSCEIESVYKDVLEGSPYNGLARVLRLQGEKGIPERFGGSCREQVSRLMTSLRSDGWTFRLPYDPTLVHSALIAGRDGDNFFMDPSLMLLRPVSMSMIPRAPELSTVETYPFVNGARGKAELSINSDGQVTVHWETPMLRPDGNVRLVEKKNQIFKEELDEENFLPNSEDPQGVRGELQWNGCQKSQYWNVLDAQTGELTTVRVMASGAVEIRKSNNSKAIREEKDNDSSFGQAMAEIARITRTSVSEVVEFLELGKRRFVELAEAQRKRNHAA